MDLPNRLSPLNPDGPTHMLANPPQHMNSVFRYIGVESYFTLEIHKQVNVPM
jgi:hypothetical protein